MAAGARAAQVSTENLEKVRKVKTRHQRLLARATTVREELERFLEDDDDMAKMCLSRRAEVWHNPTPPLLAHICACTVSASCKAPTSLPATPLPPLPSRRQPATQAASYPAPIVQGSPAHTRGPWTESPVWVKTCCLGIGTGRKLTRHRGGVLLQGCRVSHREACCSHMQRCRKLQCFHEEPLSLVLPLVERPGVVPPTRRQTMRSRWRWRRARVWTARRHRRRP